MEIINVTDEIIEINVTEAVVNVVTQNGAYPLPSNVFSVFGRVGNVVGQAGDYTTSIVAEGTNLYYTQARFNTAFGNKTTTDLAEGTNLYYTDARSRAAISENITGLEYSSASGIFSLANGYLIPTQAMLDAKQDDLNGTGIVKSTAGTISYLTDNTANWDAAYNDKINSASVSGTTTKTLTLNQQDGGTITASWTDDNTDAVTSVFGRTGAVIAANGDYTTSQVTEGTNLYFTNARVHDAISANAPLSEVSGVVSIAQSNTTTDGYLSASDWNTFNNKQSLITAGTTDQYYRGDKTFQLLNTSAVAEGTNLYYSDTRVRQAISETITGIDYSNSTGVFSLASGYIIPTQAMLDAKQDDLNGTGIVKSSGGTISYLTDNTANWDAAYNDKINSAAVTGTSTKTLTLNQQDGGTITASWTDIDTGLTSVGLSMPAAFSVSGSPLTSNGTLIVTGAGAASQYVRGDGTLADFPTQTGGGSSVSYYLNSSVSQGTIGGVAYRELSKEPVIGAGTDITASTSGYIASYITDVNDPSLLQVPGGNFNCEFYFSVNSNNHNPYVYAELYKYDGTTFTLLGSSQAIPEYLTSGTNLNPYYFAIPVASAALSITDRIALRIYVNVDTRVVTLHTEDNHLCQVVTTFSKGMTNLNNLTKQVQYLTTGTSGTNFAIVSSDDTHTFNLPTASATNTGKLSSSDWSNFNTAYNDTIVSASVSGTTTKTLTLTQQDAGTITASWTDLNTDAVSSVFGRTGAVVSANGDYTTSQVAEGTNLYYTEARVDANANVAANTAARHAAVTLGTANGLSLSTQALSLAAASTSTTGALTSTDWNTFNGKQAALNGTGFVKISGTTISYDNSTYLTTSSASATYLPLSGGTLTGALSGTSATFSGEIKSGDSITLGTAAIGGFWTWGATISYLVAGAGKALNLNPNGNTGTTGLSIATTGAATFSSSIAAASADFTGAVGTGVLTSTISSAVNAIFNSTNANGGYITFRRSGTPIGYLGNSAQLGAGVLNALELRADNDLILTTTSGSLRLTSGGVVGIGVTPASQSSGAYAGSTEMAGILRVQGVGGRYFTSGDGMEISKTSIYTYNRGTGVYNDLALNDSMIVKGGNGNVLIGHSTDSSYKLDVRSSSGNNFVQSFTQISSNGQQCGYVANCLFSGSERGITLAMFKHGDITNPATYLSFWSGGSAFQYMYIDDSSVLRLSGNSGNIGTANGTIVGTQTSDIRLKNVKEGFNYGLNDILKINPIAFTFKNDKNNTDKLGFSAQEMLNIIPESVYDTKNCIDGYDDTDDPMVKIPKSNDTIYGMDYTILIPVLVKAIQEQQAQIEELKAKILSL